MTQFPLRCTVTGPFRFKKYIDSTINRLQKYGVTVLAPDQGLPVARKSRQGFSPLESELSLSPKQVEDRFLACLHQSDFVYLVNPDGYVGQVVSFEIGACLAWNKPLYARQPIDPGLDPDPLWQDRISEIKVLPISQIVKLETERLKQDPETRLLHPTLDEIRFYTSPATRR